MARGSTNVVVALRLLPLPAGVARQLSRYLEDGTGEERWVPPVAHEAEPVS